MAWPRRPGGGAPPVTSLILIPVLIATGVLLAWHNGMRFAAIITSACARVLDVKVLLVGVTPFLTGAHGVLARRLPRSVGRALALVLPLGVVALATTMASLPSP